MTIQYDDLPDVRDGLSRKERIVLLCIDAVQKELGNKSAPTAMVYGRVVEMVDMTEDEFQAILARFVG